MMNTFQSYLQRILDDRGLSLPMFLRVIDVDSATMESIFRSNGRTMTTDVAQRIAAALSIAIHEIVAVIDHDDKESLLQSGDGDRDRSVATPPQLGQWKAPRINPFSIPVRRSKRLLTEVLEYHIRQRRMAATASWLGITTNELKYILAASDNTIPVAMILKFAQPLELPAWRVLEMMGATQQSRFTRPFLVNPRARRYIRLKSEGYYQKEQRPFHRYLAIAYQKAHGDHPEPAYFKKQVDRIYNGELPIFLNEYITLAQVIKRPLWEVLTCAGYDLGFKKMRITRSMLYYLDDHPDVVQFMHAFVQLPIAQQEALLKELS